MTMNFVWLQGFIGYIVVSLLSYKDLPKVVTQLLLFICYSCQRRSNKVDGPMLIFPCRVRVVSKPPEDGVLDDWFWRYHRYYQCEPKYRSPRISRRSFRQVSGLPLVTVFRNWNLCVLGLGKNCSLPSDRSRNHVFSSY